MSKPTVSLVNVKARNNAMALFNLAPLGLAYLGTVLKNRGYDVTIYDENRNPVYQQREDRFKRDITESDVVGFTVISPAANRAYRMARSLKQKQPDIRLAFGGPHLLSDREADRFAEYGTVVQGEGERVIEDVVRGRKTGIVEGPPVEDMDSLPIPDLDLVNSYHRPLGTEYIMERSVPLSTARGCPRDCEFCAVANMHGTRIRRRSVDHVMRELRQRYRKGYRRIFCADDNFSIVPRHREELLQRLASMREDEDRKFDGFCIQDEVPGLLKAGDDYLDLMRRAGITTIMVGIENFDPDVLDQVDKAQDRSENEEVIGKLNERGFYTYAFMLASPLSDSKQTVRYQFRKLRELGVRVAQMTIETPIPGTRFWERTQDSLLSRDWDKWDFSHCLVEPAKMKAHEMEETVREEMKQFYSLRKALRYMAEGIGRWLGLVKKEAGALKDLLEGFRSAIVTFWGNYISRRLYR